MTTYSTQAQLPLPENTDALIAESAFGDYAQALDSQLVGQYSTTGARDTANISGKIEGQLACVAGEPQLCDGSAWIFVGDPRAVQRTADLSRASTVTPTDDPQLQVALTAGLWHVELWSNWIAASAAMNTRLNWTSTGGNITIQQVSVIAAAAGVGDANDSNEYMRSASGSTQFIVGSPLNEYLVTSVFLANVTTADTLKFQWAQGTSTAANLTLKSGSYIEYRRIG